jgi:hypothetical protein
MLSGQKPFNAVMWHSLTQELRRIYRNEEEFRNLAKENGYGEAEFQEVAQARKKKCTLTNIPCHLSS